MGNLSGPRRCSASRSNSDDDGLEHGSPPWPWSGGMLYSTPACGEKATHADRLLPFAQKFPQNHQLKLAPTEVSGGNYRFCERLNSVSGERLSCDGADQNPTRIPTPIEKTKLKSKFSDTLNRVSPVSSALIRSSQLYMKKLMPSVAHQTSIQTEPLSVVRIENRTEKNAFELAP